MKLAAVGAEAETSRQHDITTLEEERAAAERMRTDVCQQLEVAKEDMAKVLRDLEEARAAVQTAEAESEEARVGLMRELAAREEQVQRQLQERDAKCHMLEASLQEHGRMVQDMQTQADESSRELQVLRAGLKESEQRAFAAEEQAWGREQERKELADKRATLIVEVETRQKHITGLEEAVASLCAEAEKMRQDLIGVHAELKTTKSLSENP